MYVSSSERKASQQLRYGVDSVAMSTFVHKMYRYASQKLLELVMKDYDLMETLRTMKRYFLLDQGDFLVHFLDAAEDELLRELSDVSRGRVQHWLSMCVQLTEPTSDDTSSTEPLASYQSTGGTFNGANVEKQFCS